MPESHQGNSGVWKSRGRLRLLAHGLGLLIVLSVAGWAGAVSSNGPSPPATNVAGDTGPAHFFARSSPATTTPTVMLTPTATVPLPVEEHIAYLPLVQKQIVIPGSLSIEEVYTTGYDGSRQATFRPCQAVVLWIRIRNNAHIPQPATLFWQTQDPEGKTLTNLSARRQVDVPPGESTWHFLGAPDLDVPAGEYRVRAWFTSGTDQQALGGVMTVGGSPAPTRYLEGMTGRIDPRNYDRVLSRTIVPRRVYAYYPVRWTDEFTPDDEFVVQSTLWEGVRPDTVILTRRYRPDGRRWGNAYYAFRDYDIRPGCVRRQNLWWPVEDMVWMPGQWRLEFSADAGETWQGRLRFTLTDQVLTVPSVLNRLPPGAY